MRLFSFLWLFLLIQPVCKTDVTSIASVLDSASEKVSLLVGALELISDTKKLYEDAQALPPLASQSIFPSWENVFPTNLPTPLSSGIVAPSDPRLMASYVNGVSFVIDAYDQPLNFFSDKLALIDWSDFTTLQLFIDQNQGADPTSSLGDQVQEARNLIATYGMYSNAIPNLAAVWTKLRQAASALRTEIDAALTTLLTPNAKTVVYANNDGQRALVKYSIFLITQTISDAKKVFDDVLALPAITQKPTIDWTSVIPVDLELPPPNPSGVTAPAVLDLAAANTLKDKLYSAAMTIKYLGLHFEGSLGEDITTPFSVINSLIQQYKNVDPTTDLGIAVGNSVLLYSQYLVLGLVRTSYGAPLNQMFQDAQTALNTAIDDATPVLSRVITVNNAAQAALDTYEVAQVLQTISDAKKVFDDVRALPAITQKPTIDWTSVIPSTAYLPTPNPSGVTAPAVLDAETATILHNKLSNAVTAITGLGQYFVHTLDPDIVDPFDVIHELLNQYPHEDPQSDLGVALAHSALLYSQYSEFVLVRTSYGTPLNQKFWDAETALKNAIDDVIPPLLRAIAVNNAAQAAFDTYGITQVLQTISDAKKVFDDVLALPAVTEKPTIDWTSVIPSTAYLPTPNPSGVTAPAVLDAETAIILKNKLSSAVATITGLSKYFQSSLDDLRTPINNISRLRYQYPNVDPQSDLGVAITAGSLLYAQYREFGLVRTSNGAPLNQKFQNAQTALTTAIDDAAPVLSRVITANNAGQAALDTYGVAQVLQTISDAKKVFDDVRALPAVTEKPTIDWTSVIPSTAYLPTPNPSGVNAPAVLDAETAIILKNKLSSAVATIRGLGKYFGHTLDPDIVDPFDVIHELLNQYSHEDPQSDLGVALAHSALLYSQYSEFVLVRTSYGAPLNRKFWDAQTALNAAIDAPIVPSQVEKLALANDTLSSAMTFSVDGFFQAVADAKKLYEDIAALSVTPLVLDWGTVLPAELPEPRPSGVTLDTVSQAMINDPINNINYVNHPSLGYVAPNAGPLVFVISPEMTAAYDTLKKLIVSASPSAELDRAKKLIAKYESASQCCYNLKAFIDKINELRIVLVEATWNDPLTSPFKVPITTNQNTSQSTSQSTNQKINDFFTNTLGGGFKTMGNGIATGFKKFGGLFH